MVGVRGLLQYWCDVACIWGQNTHCRDEFIIKPINGKLIYRSIGIHLKFMKIFAMRWLLGNVWLWMQFIFSFECPFPFSIVCLCLSSPEARLLSFWLSSLSDHFCRSTHIISIIKSILGLPAFFRSVGSWFSNNMYITGHASVFYSETNFIQFFGENHPCYCLYSIALLPFNEEAS